MLPLFNRFAAKPLEIIWKTKQNLDNFLGHQEGRHYHRNLVGIKSISRPATIYKTLRTWVTLLSFKRKNKWSHCDLLLIRCGSGKKEVLIYISVFLFRGWVFLQEVIFIYFMLLLCLPLQEMRCSQTLTRWSLWMKSSMRSTVR